MLKIAFYEHTLKTKWRIWYKGRSGQNFVFIEKDLFTSIFLRETQVNYTPVIDVGLSQESKLQKDGFEYRILGLYQIRHLV